MFPINHPLAIRVWIRVLKEEPGDSSLHVRAIGAADVVSDLADMRVGWELNSDGIGCGKHFSRHFQDPTLVCPSMAGSKYRTTLVRDGGRWLVMDLCEHLDALVDFSADFHGIEVDRYVLTIITASERPPQTMGFSLLSEGEQPVLERAMQD